MTPEIASWLLNLKMGDCVTLRNAGITTPAEIMHTTPAHIVVVIAGREIRYKRRTGLRVGPIYGWLERPA